MIDKYLSFSKPIQKEYYIGIIRIDESDINSEEYIDTVKKCFNLIRKYNGDVNQFLGSIIMALWGVPLSFINDQDNSICFFNELKNSKLPVTAILKSDKGLYGAFGDDKRSIITAISKNISNMLNEVLFCDIGTYKNEVKMSDGDTTVPVTTL